MTGSDTEERQWRTRARNGVILLAVVLSGAGSLIYQLAWTRWLVSITSATYTAQAVVLAVFMSGLALGAYFGGRVSRRLTYPLLAYAAVELAAALLAALSVPILPASHSVREWAADWDLIPAIRSGLQVTVLAVYLLLPTTLLGASLPLLIEFFDRLHGAAQRHRTARAASLLYGWNTLGAAGGCLVAGYVTIEFLGLARTIYCGMGCAAAAGALAAGLHWRGPGVPDPASGAGDRAGPEPAPRVTGAGAEAGVAACRPGEPHAGTAAPTGPGAAWLTAAGLAGFTGLAAEVLWTRLVSLVVPTTVYALAQVLAAVLLGIALGAAAAARLIRRAESDESLLRAAGLLLALGSTAMAAVPAALLGLAGHLALELQLATGFRPEFGLLVLILAPASALLGVVLPVLVGAARRAARLAGAFGGLYAANTVGGVMGSLAMGLVCLPLLGSRVSAAALVLAAAALSAWFLARSRAGRRSWSAAVALYAAAALVIAAVDTPRDLYRARLAADVDILEFREGSTSDVMVTEDGAGARRLWINSSWVAATAGGHRILGHLPALFTARPERVLGIALGTGQTFASILQHGVRELSCVELDKGVIDLSTRWFSDANDGLLQKPQVVLHHDDGRAFMRATDRRFDLIILEPLQAWSVGTTNLYTVEFYREARVVLREGGVLAQWVPFYGQNLRDTRSMVASAMEVFPQASIWLDDRDGILLLPRGRFAIEPTRLEDRIASRGVRPYLTLNAAGDVPDLLSLFLMGPGALADWTEGAPLITDDHPFLEYSAARHLGTDEYHRILASALPELDDPGKYLAPTGEPPFDTLAKARTIRRAALRASLLPAASFPARAVALEGGLAAVPESRLLRKRYGDLILAWAAGGGRNPDPRVVAGIYRRGLKSAPGMAEVAISLARLQAEQGRFAEAVAVLDAASAAPGTGRAEFVSGSARVGPRGPAAADAVSLGSRDAGSSRTGPRDPAASWQDSIASVRQRLLSAQTAPRGG